jgi:transcriptional regulator with XRE-family HTH domain
MSQEDLAGLCGLHRNSLGRIERGECDTSITALAYLYSRLDCEGVRIDTRCVVPWPIECPQSALKKDLDGMRPPEMIRILASIVRARRQDMGMSLRTASADSTVHINTLWSFEQGLVAPTITTYFRILRTLGVTRVTQEGRMALFH